MDVTGDTVDADQMTLGTTATKNDGTSVSGTLVVVPVDSSLDSSSTNAIQNAPVALAFAETVGVKLYTATLSSDGWSNTTPATYSYANASLACGKDGTIPPIIDCTSGSEAYSLITAAVATAGTGITFTIASAPSSAIGIRILDFY